MKKTTTKPSPRAAALEKKPNASSEMMTVLQIAEYLVCNPETIYVLLKNRRVCVIHSNALKAAAQKAQEQKAAGVLVDREPATLYEMADRIASFRTAQSVEGLLRSMLGDRPLDPGKLLGKLASEIEPREVRWLWPGRILAGRATLIECDPGMGKSLLTIDIAARVTIGAAWPDGAPGLGQPRNVIISVAQRCVPSTITPNMKSHARVRNEIAALNSSDGLPTSHRRSERRSRINRRCANASIMQSATCAPQEMRR
jgi:hypothetical protein